MFYISYGMMKSGSTLAFELTRALLEKHGHSQRRIVHPRMPAKHQVNFIDLDNMRALSADDLASFRQLVGPTRHSPNITVIKTHAPPSGLMCELARRGEVIGHANFRDPRDNILSLLDAGVRARNDPQGGAFANILDWNDAERSCDKGIEALEQWLRLPGFIAVSYPLVAFRSEEFLRRVSEQIGLAPWPEADYRRLASRVKDVAFTQFNQGRDRRHRDELSINQCLRLAARYREPILAYMREDLDDLDLQLIASSKDLPEPASDSATGRLSGYREPRRRGMLQRARYAIYQLRRRVWP